MDNRRGGHLVTRAVRWTARIWSVVSICVVLLFIIGEGGPTKSAEWLGFLFFPFGVCVGMALAWWWEGIGGSITVVSLLAFYAIHLATAGTLPSGWAFLVFAAPGFLFLVSWYRSRGTRRAAAREAGS
jgi:hypothetical protein